MSTGENWDVSRHTARCTSPVSVVLQCKLVSGSGLRKQRFFPEESKPKTKRRSALPIGYMAFYVIDCKMIASNQIWFLKCRPTF